MGLHPTLWRTSRVLAGETRLGLLRRILAVPGQTVSVLAHSMELSLPRASQELRRLQSRGLVRARRSGLTVQYLPLTDPLVGSAKPILKAMEECFARFPEEQSDDILRVARAFSHTRRLAIIQELQRGPRTVTELRRLLCMSGMAAYRHLNLMRESGVVRQAGGNWAFDAGEHPLARCMAKLLESGE